jgi:hypothetical protein
MALNIIALNIVCRYAVCRYADCCDLFIIILSVVMLSVVMLNVVAPLEWVEGNTIKHLHSLTLWYNKQLYSILHCQIVMPSLMEQQVLKTFIYYRGGHWKGMQWGSVTHQMAVPVPSKSCCVLNHYNLFYQIQNALAFNWDNCCHLALCLRLLPSHL